jgi:hypothetical protein
MSKKTSLLFYFTSVILGILFLVTPNISSALTNAQCAASCVGDGSVENMCAGFGTLSCSSTGGFTTVENGNGTCYQVAPCNQWTRSGRNFSNGYVVGTGSCGCEYNGPPCQYSVSAEPVSNVTTPSFFCGEENSGNVPPPTAPSPETNYFSLSISPATRSVLNGNTTTYTLTLTPDINPNTRLPSTRAVGDYELPVPIPGCPIGATCAYLGGRNTMTVTQDETSGGVEFAVAAVKTIVVTASTVIPDTYPLYISARDYLGRTESASANLIVSPSAPVVSISPSSFSVTVGQPVVFTVSATAASGLGRLGLESTNAAGTPTANLGESVVSGNSATRTFSWTPSAVGTYYFDGYAWDSTLTALTRTSPPVAITVSNVALVNNAACVSVTAPSTVYANQSFSATIRMQNTGTKTWDDLIAIPGVDGEHGLGSWNPADNLTWTIGRVRLPGGTAVPPGPSPIDFTATFTAPAALGNYPFDFRMVEEMVEWFGQPCAKAGGITVLAPVTTGTLLPASQTCTIASGASSCTVNLTWTTTNPVGTSAITATGMTNYNANSGTNVAFTVPYNARTFYLYNNGIELAHSDATAVCVAGTNWDVNTLRCEPPIIITPISIGSFYPLRTAITTYPAINDNRIYWTTTGNPTSCVASGSSPWGNGAGTAAVNADVTSGNHYQGAYPSVGTYNYILVCSKAGVADATASFSVPVTAPAITQYTLTVTKTIGGNVTSTDGLVSCGTTCVRAYNAGSIVTLQAVPDTAQWRFVGWGGSCSGNGTGNCTLTIDGDKTVTAQFRPRALLYQEF